MQGIEVQTVRAGFGSRAQRPDLRSRQPSCGEFGIAQRQQDARLEGRARFIRALPDRSRTRDRNLLAHNDARQSLEAWLLPPERGVASDIVDAPHDRALAPQSAYAFLNIGISLDDPVNGRANSLSLGFGCDGFFPQRHREIRLRSRSGHAGLCHMFMLARFLLALSIVALVGLFATVSVGQQLDETATYTNKRFGFRVSYPTARFKPQEPLSEEGRVWVSHDGNARLLAGALPNTEGMSLKDYREFVLTKSYSGAGIDYAPVRDTWFVLSGTRDGTAFYERVTFTCGGKLINSWAMIYPADESRVYNRLVEQVARSYRPGHSNCGELQARTSAGDD